MMNNIIDLFTNHKHTIRKWFISTMNSSEKVKIGKVTKVYIRKSTSDLYPFTVTCTHTRYDGHTTNHKIANISNGFVIFYAYVSWLEKPFDEFYKAYERKRKINELNKEL
jgi:hypothetical protein